MRNLLLQLILVMAAAAAILFYIDAGLEERVPGAARSVPHRDETWASASPTEELEPTPEPRTESMEAPAGRDADIQPPVVNEDFRVGYSNLSPTELAQEFLAVDEQWQGQVARACEEQVLAGRYEVTGYGDRLPLPIQDETPLVIYRLVALPDQQTNEIRKIVLPEEAYPEAYELYRRASWLSDRLRDR